jgi:hypothetical protein
MYETLHVFLSSYMSNLKFYQDYQNTYMIFFINKNSIKSQYYQPQS